MAGYHFEDPVLTVATPRPRWNVSAALPGPSAGELLMEPFTGYALIITDVTLSVGQNSRVTIYFGDDVYDPDDPYNPDPPEGVWMQLWLTSVTPFVWQVSDIRPSGHTDKPLRVSHTGAGTLYVNIMGMDGKDT